MPIHEKGWGIVFHRFWRDTKREGWSDDERLAAVYLLTNEARTLEGLYHWRIDYAAVDLGWAEQRLTAAVGSLTQRGFCRHDAGNEVMFIAKALKAQTPDSKPQVDGALSRLIRIPMDSPLVPDFVEACKSFAPNLYDSLPKAYRKAIGSLSEGTPPRSEDRKIGRSETEDRKKEHAAAAASDGYEADFEDFWRRWPKQSRKGKGDAAKAWGKLGAPRRRRAAEALTAQSAPGAQLDPSTPLSAQGRSVLPHPATWLNGHRYDDDVVMADGAVPTVDTPRAPPRREPACRTCGCGESRHDDKTGRCAAGRHGSEDFECDAFLVWPDHFTEVT